MDSSGLLFGDLKIFEIYLLLFSVRNIIGNLFQLRKRLMAVDLKGLEFFVTNQIGIRKTI